MIANAKNRWLALWVLLAFSGLLSVLRGHGAEPGQPAGNVVTGSPLPPQQAHRTFRLADARLTIELVAAEPEVVSPVAMAWDADGRLFVAEMTDYPTGPTSGRIRLLEEDRQLPGRYRSFCVFADALPFPASVLPWNGGVLVAAAPDIWFLKDRDGDGRADERRVLFTGFGRGNQQLRVNGLHWGMDNWVYGANGRSDGEIHRPGETNTRPVSLRGHDFRFRPETGQFETVAGRSQFGSTRDDWGHRFLSWNTIFIRQEVIPLRYAERNPHLPAADVLMDLAPPGDTGQVFPLTPPPLTFNNESVSHFNALAGLSVFRSEALGREYLGNAFAGESLRNLVHRRVLVATGPTFLARRGEQEAEFLASTDPWFHPVNLATGPDGALYVIDFYRHFVEHPDYVPQKLRGTIAWRTGAEHGRLWRIRNSQLKLAIQQPRLTKARVKELVSLLRHPNGWWRDTAQRLLAERGDAGAVPLLKAEIRRGRDSTPLSRVHALHTIEALGALTPDVARIAFRDPHPGVREHAVRLAERLADEDAGILKLADDPEPRVRLQAALSLGERSGAEILPALVRLARRDATNRWHALAILSSARSQAWPLLRSLFQSDEHWFGEITDAEFKFLLQAGALFGAEHSESDQADFLRLLSRASEAAAPWHLALTAGWAEGLARSGAPLSEWFRQTRLPPQDSLAMRWAVTGAGRVAASAEHPKAHRLAAIRLCAKADGKYAKPLLELLEHGDDPDLMAAAAAGVADIRDGEFVKLLFDHWKSYSPTTRRQVLPAALRSPAATSALVYALENGQVAATELDAASRQALQKLSDPSLKQRAEQVLKDLLSSNREAVVQEFQASLPLSGDRRRGAVLFSKQCLMCHALQEAGQRVGPDLSGLATRPKEALLVDILDPSRQVTPDFVSYTVVTTDGETLSGLITAENASSVTLRRSGAPDEAVARQRIAEIRADAKSLMPEGLEQGLSHQDLADLLDFLTQPDAALLPLD